MGFRKAGKEKLLLTKCRQYQAKKKKKKKVTPFRENKYQINTKNKKKMV